MDSDFKHIAEYIRRDIEEILLRVGLLCRVFGRGKGKQSLATKQNKVDGKYTLDGKRIQDAIGIRVAFYFSEDIEIVEKILSSKFKLDEKSSTVDIPTTDQFTVIRHNLIYQVPSEYLLDFQRAVGNQPIDTTFELQLRSILSEGWHEVDHDLRYKSKSNWDSQDDLSRALNGIMATLETSEWSMRKIFEDLAYRHYKKKNWPAMLHSKVRMRATPILSKNLIDLLDKDNDLAKEVFRVNRKKVIHCFAHLPFGLPVNLDNVIYVWNHIGPKNHAVLKTTPALILDALQSLPPNFWK